MSQSFKFLHTTEVPMQRTASEMMEILGRLGASNISTDYSSGEVVGMTFSTRLGDRVVTYRLPVKWQAVCDYMLKEANRAHKKRRGWGEIPNDRKQRIEEQSKRTAWRIALEWLKVQAAYVEHGIRHPAEVFLADMVVVREGVETTVGAMLLEHGGLARLTSGSSQ